MITKALAIDRISEPAEYKYTGWFIRTLHLIRPITFSSCELRTKFNSRTKEERQSYNILKIIFFLRDFTPLIIY